MTTPLARHSMRAPVIPSDRRNPGSDFLQQELSSDRRSERGLIVKALLALALVAVLVYVRQVFFV